MRIMQDARDQTVAAALKATALCALGALAWCAAASAQEVEPSQIDVSALGPQVGEVVPDFRLPDQYGNVWTRDSILGANGAMLVFVRSADW